MDRRHFLGSTVATAISSALPSAVIAQKAGGPWRRLFDGRSLEGWTFFQQGIGSVDHQRAVSIDNGVLHFLGPRYSAEDAPPGHIATEAVWSNYHLRLEYRYGVRRWPPRKLQRRNSGVLYHMGPETDRLFPDCVEFQLEEGDAGDAIMVNTQGLAGPSLGGTPLWPNWIPALPATHQEPSVAGGVRRQWHRHAGEFEKLDDWNTVDLYAFDDQAAHLVNGRIVTTLFKMVKADGNGRTTPLTAGRIALELEWAEVLFRNVMIRSLDPTAIGLIRKQGSD